MLRDLLKVERRRFFNDASDFSWKASDDSRKASYRIIFIEERQGAFSSVENKSGFNGFSDAAYLLVIARVLQHLDEIASVCRIDVQSEEEGPHHEHSDCRFSRPVVCILPRSQSHRHHERPNVIFPIISFGASEVIQENWCNHNRQQQSYPRRDWIWEVNLSSIKIHNWSLSFHAEGGNKLSED